MFVRLGKKLLNLGAFKREPAVETPVPKNYIEIWLTWSLSISDEKVWNIAF